MFEKIMGFALTVGLIAWNVVDILSGRGTVLTWVALGLMSSVGIGEAAMLIQDHKAKASATIR